MSESDGKQTPLNPFGVPTLDQLTGLVFELAAELHTERMRRIALEVALEEAAIIAPGAAERASSLPVARLRGEEALNTAMSQLMRVMTESADLRMPLRSHEVQTAPAHAKPHPPKTV